MNKKKKSFDSAASQTPHSRESFVQRGESEVYDSKAWIFSRRDNARRRLLRDDELLGAMFVENAADETLIRIFMRFLGVTRGLTFLESRRELDVYFCDSRKFTI